MLEVMARLNQLEGDLDQRLEPVVQLMTMHSAKGLSAQVVFIPGLEEEVLPGAKRSAYAGLVSEAARLLFVSVTRARAACVLSFSRSRLTQGAMRRRTPSRFCQHSTERLYSKGGLNTRKQQQSLNVLDFELRGQRSRTSHASAPSPSGTPSVSQAHRTPGQFKTKTQCKGCRRWHEQHGQSLSKMADTTDQLCYPLWKH
jgi:DNA helicase-2/ATP-dependent DNA helicase PcrA